MRVPRGYRADRGALSYATIERFARLARYRLFPEHSLDEPLPGLDLFERIDEFAVVVPRRNRVRLSYGVDEELAERVLAETRYDEDTDRIVVELSRRTYEALELDEPRARHTAFHELGHGLLHAQQLIRISRFPDTDFAFARGRATSHDFCVDTEWQADAFAAALEMPAAGLELLDRRYHGLSVGIVRDAFRVSAQAASIRIGKFHEKRSELLKAA